jgi:hypothetical protein
VTCAEARVYAGALADGEVEVVPAEAATHVAGCVDCSREAEWQRAANEGLVAALAEEALHQAGLGEARRAAARGPRRWNPGSLVATAGAAAVLVAVGVGAVLISPSTAPGRAAPPDAAMADAVHAYGAAPEYSSTELVAVNGWAAARGAALPAMTVAGASCTGARTGSVGGSAEITYLYQQGGSAVEVSVLPGEAPGTWPMSETRMMEGRAVGMVHHGNQGLIVVAGDHGQLMTFISQIQ